MFVERKPFPFEDNAGARWRTGRASEKQTKMGNNGSSGRDQQQGSCIRSSGLSEANRGWSQSFPRELARHRSQPAAARKVLPEPPNQRLRATDNGCIIHNGGTISGRKAPTFPSSRDSEKHDVPFRGRSITMSNVGESRSRRVERHRYRYQADSNRSETASSDLKRFGSEPDLRYSPDAAEMQERTSGHGRAGCREDERSPSYRRVDRETKDRIESRYKARKKYKAPAPPLLDLAVEPSSLDPRCRFERELEPPPRRSRLFKTRAETKKAQVSWQLSGFNRSIDRERERDRERDREPNDRIDRMDRMDVVEQEAERDLERGRERTSSRRGDSRERSDNEIPNVLEWQERDRFRRRNDHRHGSKVFGGKNTLQRSMSSPEFQAELIQAAKRVRDKLDCGRRVDESMIDFRSLDADKLAHERSLEAAGNHAERSPPIGSLAEERVRDAGGRLSPSMRNRSDNWLASKFGRSNDEIVDGKIDSGDKPNLDRDQGRRPLRERLEDVEIRARNERRHPEGHRRVNEVGKYGKSMENASEEIGRSTPDNRMARFIKDASEIRGWPAGRATPEKMERQVREKENSDPSWWSDDFKSDRRKRVVAEQWTEADVSGKLEAKFRGSSSGDMTTLEEPRREDSQTFASPAQSAPKTFYFGMNETLTCGPRNEIDQREEEARLKLRDREDGRSVNTVDDTDDNGRNMMEDISLKLRPTLPKKQLEIPRFSPSAAWRLLSSLDAPGPSMSTTSEEMPVMFEERIERLSRPPPPLLALGPRSLHDKSGDSGISGDAGAPNEDSLDVSTMNRMKTAATRPTWTPQQDLGEELSSDAGVDSPPPLPATLKYPPRAHVFSLSLPRDDGKTYLYSPDAKAREGSAFNSLKKLKRSVSGAFGIGAHDVQRKRAHDILDDNWLLSTSAPTSLQHSQMIESSRMSSCAWKLYVAREREHVDGNSVDNNRSNDRDRNDTVDDDGDRDGDDDDIVEDERIEEDTDGDNEGKDFPVILKPPSFSYLAPGGHVMYLPESNEAEYRVQSLNGRKIGSSSHEDLIPRGSYAKEMQSRSNDDGVSTKRRFEDSRSYADAKASRGIAEFSSFREPYRSSNEVKERRASSARERENLQSNKDASEPKEAKSRAKGASKSRRFTFQSTVRQIERRRLAEKLSREAEAKERQRRGEMEAMRKVEEEFQRKRAKEKASIRQQLRLFKEMEENFNRLPSVEWDGSQLSRADPDGAPSSTTSSPTSLPAGKLAGGNLGKSLPPEYRQKGDSNSSLGSSSALQPKQRRDEQRGYRPKYYDWPPETSSHLEHKQTTVHPKVVCDIPKSSPVFVDVNAHNGKPAASSSTPRSDNYRKDFAHGTVGELTRSSFASSDSELSQPNTRPHSRQIEIKGKPQPSRSASPARSEDAATSEEDLPVDPAKWPRSSAHDIILNSVQPFTKDKTYRPISFNPQPPPPIPS